MLINDVISFVATKKSLQFAAGKTKFEQKTTLITKLTAIVAITAI